MWLKSIYKFHKLLFIILLFSISNNCTNIVLLFLDKEPKIEKINDSIYYNVYHKELMLRQTIEDEIYTIIKDCVSHLFIKKDTIFLESSYKQYFYSKDTLIEISVIDSKIKELKSIESLFKK